MTHRSRSGGPIRKKPVRGTKKQPKLHHPPNRSTTETEPTTDTTTPSSPSGTSALPPALPASAFTTPTDADMLAVLRASLRATLDAPDFASDIQRVKALLYDRRWLELFTDPRLLDAYAGRWVPSRALCFRDLLASLRGVRELFTLDNDAQEDDEGDNGGGDDEAGERRDRQEGMDKKVASDPDSDSDADSESESDSDLVRSRHILSIGGGAGSELLAIAALAGSSLANSSAGGTTTTTKARWTWTGADIGEWGSVLDRIEREAKDTWDLGNSVQFNFIAGDVLVEDDAADTPQTASIDSAAGAGAGTDDTAGLTPTPAPTPTPPTTTPQASLTTTTPVVPVRGAPRALPSAPAFLTTLPPPDLTTILFTLTELLSQSRLRTVGLLRGITARTPRGGLLLVADSASDISEFSLGKDGRKWPVWMVLDVLVLGAAGVKTGRGEGWERVRGEDSRWFRLGDGVGERWPCKLENVRYWMRLYRRIE